MRTLRGLQWSCDVLRSRASENMKDPQESVKFQYDLS